MTKEKILKDLGLVMDFMDKLPEGARIISIDISDLSGDKNDVNVHLYGNFDFRKFAEMYGANITEKPLKDMVLLTSDMFGCNVLRLVPYPEGQSQKE